MLMGAMYRFTTILNALVGITSLWLCVYMVVTTFKYDITYDVKQTRSIVTDNTDAEAEADTESLSFEYRLENASVEDSGNVFAVPEVNSKKDCECPVSSNSKSAMVPGETRTHRTYSNPNKLIRILSWTQLWGKVEGPWFEEGSALFDKCGFDPHLSCEYTHDRSLYDQSDAVLFHAFWIKDLPKYRFPDQKWVFWEYESPRIVSTQQNITDFRHMFNISSTYSMESDVPLPFLRKCVPTPGESNVKSWADGNFAYGKTRQVAWFVSHCQTPSKRENYAKELQKYIPVDIYGDCGPYKCDKTDPDKCYHDLQTTYKFYLAFENSFCRDYVTEKLWNIFDHRLNIIPVVLGHVDYSNLLPKGTYINVKDFKSPRELATYLKYVDENDDVYNSYIRARTFDTCRYTTPYSLYYCGLCEHLHRRRVETEVLLDAANMWSMSRRCLTARAFYSSCAPTIMDDKETSKQGYTLN